MFLSDVVICRAKLFFGLVEQRPGLLWLGALKRQPRFLNLDGGCELFEFEVLSQLTRGNDVF